MGTRFNFLTYGLDEVFFSSAKTFIINELERIEQKFTRYNDESEISKINKLAATEPVPTDAETLSLLALDNASPGADSIILDFDLSTVFFQDTMISIDLGGIGKGYALEKIKQYCTANGIANALISFGDSSITTLGSHPHGDYWPIGIQDSFSPGSSIYTFKLNDSSLSTSGNNPNNQIKFGANGHIINPLTGKFQKELKTVSVVADSPIEAEILSTSLFIAEDKVKAEILSQFKPMESIAISYNQMKKHQLINLNHELNICK
jgi:thiamine biosynthesis lipoprotein